MKFFCVTSARVLPGFRSRLVFRLSAVWVPGCRSKSTHKFLTRLLPGFRQLAFLFGILLSAVFSQGLSLSAQSPLDQDHFENHVRPVLVKNCIQCHGPVKRESGLDLTTVAGMLRGGDSGAAIVPGKPNESLLLHAIRYQSLQMPPDNKLSDLEVEQLINWVDRGAYWPQGQVLRAVSQVTDEDRQWWCVQAISDPTLPNVQQVGWCRNEIDWFILQRLEHHGLSPAPEASAEELYRRAHFALTGLPPQSNSESKGVRAFSDDVHSADWYERMIDQLLADKSYGENQARYWLDLVRYADSDGYRADALRPAAAQYRQYVIDAFNSDKHYDRFIMEQLAGDEIDPSNRESIVATMFLRHWIYEHNQRDVEGQWQEILDDVTETTADTFLALGLKCARCHDHKYDPLLQKDFFRLQAFFAPLHPREDLPVATVEERQQYLDQLTAWENATKEIRLALYGLENPTLLAKATREGFDKFVPEIKAMILKQPYERTPREHQIATLAQRQYDLHPGKLPEWLDKETEAQRQSLLAELAKFDEIKPKPLPTQAFVATDVGPVAPPTWILGDPEKQPVLPGPPTIIDEDPTAIEPPHAALQTTGRRTALAKWIASANNPLTARVIVNRVWEQHFGAGLVENASDFGRLGEPPTHPELLDWLASRFIEDGWSLKQLHRRILISATYRQSSRVTNEVALRKDPNNRLIWRMNARRLSSEEIVDSMLLVSGELDAGEANRAIYDKVMRNNLPAMASLFDFPDRIRSVSKRHRTTTSTQALMLMNNDWVLDRAKKMHSLLARHDSAQFVEVAYQRIYSRSPDKAEIAAAFDFMQQYSLRTAKQAAEHPMSTQDLARIALLHTLLNSNELIYID